MAPQVFGEGRCMPEHLADYGLGFFALGVVAWVVVAVFGKKSPDLTRVIADNTKALTQLTTLIEQQGKMVQEQGEVLRRQAELLGELKVEIVRKIG